jgi:WD40 repeat protein
VGQVDVPALSSESHLATTPDGLLVAGGRDAIVAVDLASMTQRWAMDTRGSAHPENCPWLAVAPSSGRLYCGDYYGVIHERDLATGVPTGVLLDPQNGSVGRLAVSSDGRELVAFGAEAPVVSRWRLDGSGPITRLVAPGHVVYDGYDASGASLLVAARPTGSHVDDDFHDFAVWDPVTDRSTAAWSDVEGLGWAGRDTVTGFASEAGRLEYFDSTTGDVVDGDRVPLDAGHLWSSDVARRLYVGFPTGDVWTVDAMTRRRIEPTIRAGGRPWSVSGTRGGARVVVTAFAEGEPLTAVYDGASGRELDRGLDGVYLTSVSADGVLVGASGGRITRFDLDTLAPLATFPVARGEINSLQFSRDGALLLATSNDQTVSLYDVESGTRLGDPIPTAAPFIVPGFLDPDGSSLAVTAQQGVALWDVTPDHLLAAACRTAGRNLTRGEWTTYLGNLGAYRTTC